MPTPSIRRPSDAPAVRAVSQLAGSTAMQFLALPDGSWDLVILKHEGKNQVMLTGLATQAVPVQIAEGDEILNIAFKASSHLQLLSPLFMLNRGIALPVTNNRTFQLGNDQFEIPSFDNAEALINKMVQAGLLVTNEVVEAVLQDRSVAMSSRTLQRQFLRTTGMTHNYFRQITRANQAAKLLASGKSLPQVAYESGYADQSHMTRSLRHIIGRTPGEIVRDNSGGN